MTHPRPHYAEHAPLLTPAGDALLRRMEQHPHAPRWDYTCGDRLMASDLPVLDALRADLDASALQGPEAPPERILDQVWTERATVPHLARLGLQSRSALAGRWADLPTVTREDLALRIHDFVPLGADLKRMVVYTTSGTTGHPLLIPNHPVGAAAYQLLMTRALKRWGVNLPLGPDAMANALVCAQAQTIQYASTLAVWEGAGHVKVNLHPNGWRDPADASAYLADFDPPLLTGDPVSFGALLALKADLRPAALVSTALALGTRLQSRLKARFPGAAVLEWYSMNEVGPVAYSCPHGHGLHVLDPAVYVEIVDPDGRPVPAGTRGEIALTGGRNPLLRLVRYRTGDYAAHDVGPCSCGDPAPRIVELEGRAPVVLWAANGTYVNPVDVSRVLQTFPLVQHQLVQHPDRTLTLTVRPPLPEVPPDVRALKKALGGLFGRLEVRVEVVPRIEGSGPGGKVVPYVQEGTDAP